MHARMTQVLSGTWRTSLLLAGVLAVMPATAAERQVVGLITQLLTVDSGNTAAPQYSLAIKPAVQDCLGGHVLIPSSQTMLGSMLLSLAVAAQTSNNAVNISYERENCTITQLEVLTP